MHVAIRLRFIKERKKYQKRRIESGRQPNSADASVESIFRGKLTDYIMKVEMGMGMGTARFMIC